jgi:hypothetical protein
MKRGVGRPRKPAHHDAYTLPSKDIPMIFDPETGERFPVMAGAR